MLGLHPRLRPSRHRRPNHLRCCPAPPGLAAQSSPSPQSHLPTSTHNPQRWRYDSPHITAPSSRAHRLTAVVLLLDCSASSSPCLLSLSPSPLSTLRHERYDGADVVDDDQRRRAPPYPGSERRQAVLRCSRPRRWMGQRPHTLQRRRRRGGRLIAIAPPYSPSVGADHTFHSARSLTCSRAAPRSPQYLHQSGMIADVGTRWKLSAAATQRSP